MSNNSSTNISPIEYASAGCTIGSSVLSICGAFVIFWTYGRISSVRNFQRTLLTWLTIADLMIATGNLVGTIDFLSNKGGNNDVCIAQSVVTTFASMASFFWTLVITAHMMVSIQFRSDKTRSALLKFLYHLICWGLPGIITLVAGLRGVLGRNSNSTTAVTGSWCWIKNDLPYQERITWMLITGKGWEILCYILSFSILVLLKLKLYLSRRRLRELNEDFRDQDTHYLYLWLLLWLLRVWGTVRFILVCSQSDDNVAFLIILHSIGDSAQAFGNCLLFCLLDNAVMEYVKNMCKCSRLERVELERLVHTLDGSTNNGQRGSYSTV
ncbi:hypothetical protein ACJMK2_027319 [Sinanodonta woodiana]|uniref:G-protein coupled receptors family 2 profile 2 domain-containing protein n=1 Tax=Sinanodonta woodiana TaxID=1069815 RepID=A0ABD3XQP4_SINWO